MSCHGTALTQPAFSTPIRSDPRQHCPAIRTQAAGGDAAGEPLAGGGGGSSGAGGGGTGEEGADVEGLAEQWLDTAVTAAAAAYARAVGQVPHVTLQVRAPF